MIEPVSLLIAAAICAPALLLASLQSSWLIDYLFFVVALNRGIRRIVDYQIGDFNPYSPISLTPLVVGGLATLVILNMWNSSEEVFGARVKRVLFCYTVAIAMGFVVGFLNARFGAVYALGDYLAPIGLIGFASIFAFEPRVVNRWCASMALSALVVATYGIWQFYTIPAWDAFWLVEVDFVGYMGYPEPTKMALFSTMAERGPAASFLCSGLIILLLKPGVLSYFRLPIATIVFLALYLTYVRTSIIQLALALLLFPVLNRGAGLLPIGLICLAAVVAGPSLLERLPGSEQASARVASIGNLAEDGSMRGRLGIIADVGGAALSQPLGLGIGSHGLASRVSKASIAGSGDSTGYIETLRTLGWHGATLVAIALFAIWKSSSHLLNYDWDDDNSQLLRVWFASGLAAMFSGNWMFAANFFWILVGYTLTWADKLDSELESPIESPREQSRLESWHVKEGEIA